MKAKTLIRKSVVGVACMSFMLGTAAMAAENQSQAKRRNNSDVWQSTPRAKVIFVEVTGSRIPQRVVLHGQQVDSASPLYVFGRNDLLRSGAVDVSGVLAMDPSITFSRRH
jgi:hypothetical protein